MSVADAPPVLIGRGIVGPRTVRGPHEHALGKLSMISSFFIRFCNLMFIQLHPFFLGVMGFFLFFLAREV
jgi:hypothetical protein